ncbi:MAG: (2Fe-2S)-binding protein [Symbiobacteriaceae bacterium]|nr:(2Fe-2S)-binding protein [Symbiobacteriaceae bacterium]
MRLSNHPILTFRRGEKISFFFNGQPLEAYLGETIAASLHAAGIYHLSDSAEKHRARGFFCAIGQCSSCMMLVNGRPNVKTCTTLVKPGMVVESQQGKGQLPLWNNGK